MNSKFEGYSKVIKTYGILIVFFIVVLFLARGDVESFGPVTLIPAAFLLVYIFYTKRILESLMLGGLLGFLMAHKGDFFSPLSESFLNIIYNDQ
jgi:tetracycline resistance efflux pump